MESNLLFIPGAAYVETRTGRSEGEVLRVIPDIDSNKKEEVWNCNGDLNPNAIFTTYDAGRALTDVSAAGRNALGEFNPYLLEERSRLPSSSWLLPSSLRTFSKRRAKFVKILNFLITSMINYAENFESHRTIRWSLMFVNI